MGCRGAVVAPSTISTVPSSVVAAVGVAVDVVATMSMAPANRRSLNVEGAYRHILTDLYGFAGTLVAGIVVVIWASTGPTPLRR